MRTDAFLQFARERNEAMLELLRRLVECESPSSDKAAVDRCLDLVEAEAQALGARTTRHRSNDFGNHLQAGFDLTGGSAPDAAHLLVLGHSDTVWDAGTLERMPFRIADGRVWGPGVLDMKAGIVSALFAIRALRDQKTPVARRITLLLTSDEEVGSPTSREVLREVAAGSAAALVVEPATGLHGALKTARKGVGDYHLTVHGRAAHAGVDPTKGASAVHELARQITRIAKFTRLRQGITVNVGVISGGTRSNVIAEQAAADIDVRIVRAADEEYLKEKFASLKPFDSNTRLEVHGGLNRPPMERTPAIVALFRRARELGRPLGLELKESMTGGGSDGNFTAAMGIPTLDGLGGVGEGAHAIHESILLDQFPLRTALLAHLLAAL